jgi:hypothetical protein
MILSGCDPDRDGWDSDQPVTGVDGSIGDRPAAHFVVALQAHA